MSPRHRRAGHAAARCRRAIIGGVIGGLLDDNTNIFELNALGFIIAVVAAVLLVGVAEGLSGRSNRAVR